MVQDSVLLDTRQHELRNTVNRRKRKLQELYRVTCATANALRPRSANDHHNSTNKATLTELDFLDANDLTKGRIFDVTTLRRLPGAGPLHDIDGSWLGPPQQYTQAPPSQPAPPTQHETNLAATTLDNTPLSGPSSLSTLSAPNGISNGSRPRSPISPVDEPNGKGTAASQDAIKSTGQVPNVLASVKDRTPATPPAETTDPSHPANNGQDAATNAHEALKNKTKDAEVKSTPAGPESQLLLEAAQSRVEPPEQFKTAGTANGTAPDQPSKLSQQENGSTKTAVGVPAPSRAPAKPPMRIDTSVTRPMPSATATATATPPVSAVGGQVSPPERMRTRVSSGAIRHKSVSEILGETPRTSNHERTPSIDKTVFSPADSIAQSRRFSQISGTPDSAAFKRRLSDLRGKEKDLSHQSMVVFARQGHDDTASRELVPKRGLLQGVDDYLLPLFLAQASGHSTGLAQLLASSRKTLTTANHHLEARELRDCRILKRIYTLQSTNKWSLRQPARAIEPDRPATHWDALLAEARWMRTDFKEERKWKHAQARILAYACAEWIAADETERSELQIKTRKPTHRAPATTGITPDSTPNANSQDEAVPDLVPSNDDDTSEEADDEMHLALAAPLPPAAVFSLGPDDLTFALGETPISQKLLNELPMYNPLHNLQLRSRGVENRSMDESWRKPMTLVSRWNDGKIVFPESNPTKRRKTSRYDYANSPEPEDEKRDALPPEDANVAMFRPDNRHIIQRLHASHAFRLPPMPIPSQDFFQNRQPSQWTRQEEDQLRRLVREYAFNWSLISSMLASVSIYSSGAERRTPWECFERWEMLEGMPTEYARHEFYKRWHLRRTHAKARHEEQYRQAQEQAQAGQVQRLRRNGEPQTVDRRRSDKHIYVFQSMAKMVKKKETQIQKQQHMAAVAANRKAAEPAQNARHRMRTPAEFSNHKHKQEQEMRQKIFEHRQQQQRDYARAQHARAAGTVPPGASAAPQPGRSSVPSNGTIVGAAPSSQAGMVNNPSRLLPPGQGMMNGTLPSGIRTPGAAQPQAHYQQGQTGTGNNTHILAKASQVSEQQRLMQQSRQYSAMGSTGQQTAGLSLPQQNGASFQNLQQQAGKLSPAINGQRPASSPRGVQAVPANVQQLSSGVTPAISQIKNHLKSLNPSLSDAEINRLAAERLSAQVHAQNAQATSTNSFQASGQQNQQSQRQGPNAQMMQSNMANGMNVMNSQQYAAAMRQQMQQQSSRGGPNGTQGGQNQSTPRPESRGVTATSQNRANTATPSSAATRTSQSPRQPNVQVASK